MANSPGIRDTIGCQSSGGEASPKGATACEEGCIGGSASQGVGIAGCVAVNLTRCGGSAVGASFEFRCRPSVYYAGGHQRG